MLNHARAVARKKVMQTLRTLARAKTAKKKVVKREDKDDRAKRTVADIFGALPDMV